MSDSAIDAVLKEYRSAETNAMADAILSYVDDATADEREEFDKLRLPTVDQVEILWILHTERDLSVPAEKQSLAHTLVAVIRESAGLMRAYKANSGGSSR